MKIIVFNRKEFQEWKYFLKLLDHLLKKIKERWNEFQKWNHCLTSSDF